VLHWVAPTEILENRALRDDVAKANVDLKPHLRVGDAGRHDKPDAAVQLVLADGFNLERRGVEDNAIIVNIECDHFSEDGV